MEAIERTIKIRSPVLRRAIAEYFGTVLLVYIGTGSGAAYFLYGGTSECSTSSKIFAATFAGAIGLFVALATTYNISGGHLNPNVTLAMALTGQFPWREVPGYMVAQYLGAFTAAMMMFATYFDGIDSTHADLLNLSGSDELDELKASSAAIANGTSVTANGPGYGYYDLSTGALFYSTPAPHTSLLGSFTNHYMASLVFLVAISAVTDRKNIRAPHPFAEVLSLALVLLVVSQSFSANAGALLNPAADLSPRFFTAIAGWGFRTFTAYQGGHYWWLSCLGSHLGGISGIVLYKILIGAHCPPVDEHHFLPVKGDDDEHHESGTVKYIVNNNHTNGNGTTNGTNGK